MKTNTTQAKEELRKTSLDQLSRLTDKASLSTQIVDQLRSLDCLKEAHTLLCFVPLKSEPQIRPLLDYFLAEKKTIALPSQVSSPDSPSAHIFTRWEELEASPIGVLQPSSLCKKIDLTSVQAVLVPGLAFDRENYRLGRGGGYYDRLLSLLPKKTLRIGVFFSCQEAPKIPTENHDIDLHKIVTEKG